MLVHTRIVGVDECALMISLLSYLPHVHSIIRKVKLSPSSRFNRKLAPVDFGMGRRDSDIFNNDSTVNFAANHGSGASSSDTIAWPMHRSPSSSSNGHGHGNNMGSISGGSLRRNDSMANAGLDRSDSYGSRGHSNHGHAPQMSEK